MSDRLAQLQRLLQDRYRILHELGHGGMATVYLAEDLKHGRQVAIKVIKPDLAAAIGIERFQREIDIASHLNHPHILGIHDSGEADGVLYYVMPYLEGETLAQRIGRETQLRLEDALTIAAEMADALAYAHSQDIVHRDIKPANVMFSGGHVVITDFGIARAMASGETTLTETGLALGTPAYISPEQAMGERTVDDRSDIYSLGCVLYEMLVGAPPFAGATGQAIVARHIADTPPGLRVVRPAIPESVELIVATMLQKTAADRYATAKELVEVLRAEARDSASGPRQAEAPVRSRRTLWISLGALSALTAVVLVGLGVRPTSLGTGEPGLITGVRVLGTSPLTRDRGLELHPAISPDGSEVAFIQRSTMSPSHLRLVTINGSTSISPAEGTPLWIRQGPFWSDDGTSILFIQQDQKLAIVPKLGGPIRVIGEFPGEDWGGPTGDWILYARQVPDGDSVRRLVGARRPDGTGDTLLFDVTNLMPDNPWAPRWSPDGSMVAFGHNGGFWGAGLLVAGDRHPAEIWVGRLGEETPVKVASGCMNLNPVWLPDGRSLLFISDRDGQRGIYFQRLGTDGSAEGEPIPLPLSNDAHSMSISRDGRVLAFSAFRASHNIWRVPIPETGTASMADAIPVTDQVQVIETFDVSPDGSMVAFDSDLSTSCDYNIFLLRDGEMNPRQITSHEGNEWRPRFSPDGGEIVFHAQRSTDVERDIYTVPSSGGPPQLIVSTEEREWYSEWSPGGSTIAYLRKPSPAGELTLISRDSLGAPWGEPRSMERVIRHTGYRLQWTPDGRFLTYWQFGPRRLVRLSLEGEESVVGLPDLPGGVRMGGSYDWSADGGTLYVNASHEDGSRGVWQIPLHGGEPRLVLKFDPDVPVAFRHVTATDLYLLVGEAEADIHLLDLELVWE